MSQPLERIVLVGWLAKHLQAFWLESAVKEHRFAGALQDDVPFEHSTLIRNLPGDQRFAPSRFDEI